MFRFLITILSTIALLVVWRPAVVHGQEADGRLLFGADSALADGQDTTTTTHVVRAGETLWGIAARYYGDGHQ
jgi:nucleoid-associated protein YgaU